jgi:hypothetical protein
MMLVNRLQEHLETLYEVHSGYKVADFLIDDPSLAQYLDNTPTARDIPEKLLIRQDGDCVDLALYLDPELLRRLNADDPTQSLHSENLHDFWTALEGISHFLYFTWHARNDRTITLLEMELQAEVDKYIMAVFMFGTQMNDLILKALYRYLFEEIHFDHRLNKAEYNRYHRANYFAARFCSFLEKKFMRPNFRRSGLINMLRRFYRLSQYRKIKTIRSL